MRIDAVIAYAFGPFRDKRFELAPGMTVIFGPNEAGKSSLHAALYAGLCGVRRGKGQPRKEDQRFAELHRPWDERGRWEVGAIATLGSGRRVETRHDLNGRVDCRATDDFGRDVSAEIMNEGTPDASRWLGLDRRAFLSTACVGQTDVMAILEDASELQEELQRAAASTGKDETAAGALALIDEFRREQVGRDQVHATKPLRRAREQVQKAKADVGSAERDHDLLIELATAAELAAAEEAKVVSQIELIEAAEAKRQADLSSAKVARIRELSSKLASERPPELSEDEALAQLVAGALQAWTERPAVSPLSGPGSDEIQKALDELPAMPLGDVESAPSVQAAFDSYQKALQAIDLHESTRPVVRDSTSPASEEELLSLARDLEIAIPPVDRELGDRRERLRAELGSSIRSPVLRRILFGAAALLAIAGLVVLARGAVLAGAGLLILGLGGCIGLLAGGGQASRARLLERLREVENTLGGQLHAALAAEERIRNASDRLKQLKLSESSDGLRRLAEEIAASRRARSDLLAWKERRALLDETLRAARAAFEMDVTARGETAVEPNESMKRYLAGCQERKRIATLAAERPRLESRLADRRLAEKSTSEVVALRRSAEQRVHDAASQIGLAESATESLVSGLRDWRLQRQERLKKLEADRHDWTTREALLAGHTIEELERDARDASEQASRLRSSVDPLQLDSLRVGDDLANRLVGLRAALHDTTRSAGEIKARLEEQRKRSRSVAEAEERLARSEADLDRVLRLDEILSQTQRFLEGAQARVHRTIAPVLRDTLNKWLPRITNGRYAESAVDPETLEVKVRAAGGTWREAALLSQGTAEEVYLLLRIAIAEHLTRESREVCPVILDDVLVQIDDDRKKALLDLLHEISSGRQIVLFTMEQIVADWAEANLKAPQDLVIRLDPSEVAA
jgi:exonuclease SbcC